MAFAITSPATANITDTQTSVSVAWSGATTGTNWYIFLALRINGVNIATYSGPATATGSQTLAIASNAQAIYNAAKGHGLSGAVEIYAESWNDDYPPVLYVSTKSGGTLTINYRIKNLSLTEPATANKWDMDQVVGNLLTSSWTRTNSAFLARLKGWVWNGSTWILVFNRYGYSTSSNTDVIALGYKDAIVAAMNSVSPRDFKLQIITQFDDGTADYLDLSYTESEVVGNYTKRTASYGVSKVFVTLSTISIGNFDLLPIAMSVPFTLTTYGSYPHTIRLYLKKPDGTAVLIKIQSVSAGVTSGLFAIESTERDIILNTLPGVTYATTYAEVDTDTYGTTDSKSVATTLSLNADFKPTIGTVSWIEYWNYVKKALGYGVDTPFFLMSKSQLQFTVPVTNSVGATTTSIRVQFAGTDKTQANSPVITDLLNGSGSLMATITVVDSRGRSASYTTSAITVRPYTYPKVDKLEVYRSNSGGIYDPTAGTYLRCIIKGTATTVKALDGTTEKNWIKYKIDYRVKNNGSYSNNVAVVPGGLTFGELTTSALAGFIDTNIYDIRIRVFDAFYDLDDDESTLEDTDDYAEGNTLLPSCDVSLTLGRRYASIGKKYGGVGTLDVAEDTGGISIKADGDVYSNDTLLSFASRMPTDNLDTTYKAGRYYYTSTQQGRPNDYGVVDVTVGLGEEYNGTNNWLMQTAYPAYGTKIYQRKKIDNGGWSAWATWSDDSRILYEEGNWTPASWTYQLAVTALYNAKYIKIGKMVFVECYIQYNNTSGGVMANIAIGGLPYYASGHGFAHIHYAPGATGTRRETYVGDTGYLVIANGINIANGVNAIMIYASYPAAY
jgi:hypothetical protein